MNEDVVVMDAELAGSSGLYDINEEVLRLYEFNLDQKRDVLEFPEMSRRHRGVIFDLTKKYGMDYMSQKKNVDDPEALAKVSVKKGKGYQSKVWPSPFGPEQASKKKNYDKIPTGHSCILEDFLFLGSGKKKKNDERFAFDDCERSRCGCA